MNWKHNTGPGVGRRVSSDLYPGKVGTVVKVRLATGADLYPTYDVAFDDATGVERVAHALITGPSWRVLPEMVSPKAAEDRRLAFLETKLRERTELARQRLAGRPHAEPPPSASFYRPSDTFINAGDVIRLATAPNEAKLAAKALRELLARELEGVRVTVQTKADVVQISWVDGPVAIGRLTDRFAAGRAGSGDGPVAGRVTTRRDISDELVESAIEFVRQVTGEPLRGATAAHFRDGMLRDVYPRSGPYSGLSIGRLVRLALSRWDDFDRRFVSEGPTRAMVLENEALFPGKDVLPANARMRLIRRSIGELSLESASMEQAVEILERQRG
jgi:hypothetical protein